MYKERVEELDPSIRYCRHNLLRQVLDLASLPASACVCLVARWRRDAYDVGCAQGGGQGGESERLLLSDMSSDLLKGKMDKVLSGDGESALEVAWLHHTVPVTHPTLRQHILAAQGYAVSCCAGRGSGHVRRRCMLAGQHRSAPATCAAFAPRTRCKRGGKG